MLKIRKATAEDVNTIVTLTQGMAEKGLMLPRSKYKIISMLCSFYIAETEDNQIVGCGALILLWTDLAEIAALAVKEEYWGQGIGSQIVKELIEEARRIRVPEIFVLTYCPNFFKKLGFVPTDKDSYPRKVWRECLECPKLENCDENALQYDVDLN